MKPSTLFIYIIKLSRTWNFEASTEVTHQIEQGNKVKVNKMRFTW